ncbi:MAG: sensor domain-containing diguanylate cyclase [Lachnospiraceae bacterium]|nr:sensor domain-containing diguanylate cyclase [Lachnospiraceae bacterium]
MHKYMQNYLRVKYILAGIVAVLMCVAMMLTVSFFDKERVAVSDFSADWTVESTGEIVVADDVNTGNYGCGTVVISKQLPEDLQLYTGLCFISNNSAVRIFVGDRQIYGYDQPENFTGRGYGTAYHTINLSPDFSGQRVYIEFRSVFNTGRGGRIRMLSLEKPQEYRNRLAKGQLLPFNISVGVMIVGVILIFFRIIMPYKKSQADLLYLGINAFITGVWLAVDTGFLRLIMGAVIVSRVADYVCMHLWAFPMMLFLYTTTKQRKPVYRNLAIALFTLDASFFIIMRYAFATDMSSLTRFFVAYILLAVVLMTVMLIDDTRFCRAHSIIRDRKFFYTGLMLLVVCGLTDMMIYLSGTRSVTGRGSFSRLGFVVFFILMAIEAINTWVGEQTTMRRDRFINRILHFAVSSNDPEVRLRAIIEHFGVEFGADHAYIFENRCDGTFHNTYDWYADGAVRPEGSLVHDIPYAGLVDDLYDVFMRDHRLIVDDSEETRKLNKILYNIVHSLKLERLMVAPLEYNGELIGIMGVDNVPKDEAGEVADIIWLMSYFVTQLLLQRDEKRDLVRYSYVDSLTGAHNRRAMNEFEQNNADVIPYGFVMCDINGLKRLNDTQGHDAGDMLIIDVAQSLIDVFGENYVFRLGGDEFAAYSFADSKEEFEGQVAHVRALIAAKHRSVSLGAVYVTDPDADRKEMKEEADSLMYKEKEEYYRGRNDRRR